MILWWLGACVATSPSPWPGLVVEERAWVDETRETPALLDLPGAPERLIEVRIWVGAPAAGPRGRPLLLMAHGLDGDPTKFEAFAQHVAGAGAVVAAVRFPASHFGSGAGIPAIQDLVEQPGDLTVALDGLLEAVEDPEDPLFDAFDPGAIVALGHSLGGATVLGWTRFEDPEERVAVTAYLSPAATLATTFGPQPSVSGPPTLLLHGLDDPVVSFPESERLHGDLDDTVLVGLLDGEHSLAIEDQDTPPHPARARAQELVVGLLQGLTGEDAGALGAALDHAQELGNEVRRDLE